MAPVKRLLVVGVALAGLGPGSLSVARGQALPGIGGVSGLGGAGGLGGLGGLGGAAVPAGAVPAVAAPVAAAPKGSIWSCLGLTKGNLAACRAAICGSPLGQMLNGAFVPLSGMTGGALPTLCPTVPSAAQAAALAAAAGPTSAQAVAAKIQQDEAEAAARRAAVRYLSTVDCHYWPEAEAALIGSLRDDRNECVRYEAALALLNGCCCTAKTIEALKIVVAGTETDGKPSETSDRVRNVAMGALEGCLLRFHPPAPPVPLERPEPASTASAPAPGPRESDLPPTFRRVAYYYVALHDVPAAVIVADARRVVGLRKAERPTYLVTGKRTVTDALALASLPDPPSAPAPARPAAEGPATAGPNDAAPPPPAIAARPAPGASPRGGRNLRDIFLKSTEDR